MTIATRALLLFATVAAISTGCGKATGNTAAPMTSTDAKADSTHVSIGGLQAAVRTAIRANVQLSTYVLWHNSIPKWATNSTRGPALTSLRSAATTRRRQGIAIKNLSGHYTVISIALAPSYASATATVRTQQRVAPFKAGHRLGKAISTTEHVRIQLHRLANAQRFVVWRVTPIK
jgi:hypothetical protein